MTPYADDWRKWRESQSSAGDAVMAPGMSSGVSASVVATADDDEDDVNAMLEETRGCAVMDSGATVMCSSTLAAEAIQEQRLNQQEPGVPTVRDSDRRFRLADGGINEANKMVEQPITAGLLSGKTMNMHLIDSVGNDTSPLFSIDEMRRLRMVVDYEENKVMFKDNPDVWHVIPVTKKGLMMIPLTKEACERHQMPPPPPQPTTKTVRKRSKKDRALVVEGCSCERRSVCDRSPLGLCR